MLDFIIKTGISSFAATIGFGILFNIRGRRLFLAGLTGMVAGIIYKFSLFLGMSELVSNFLGALGLSLLGELFARVCKTPATTFIVCALIPLVPGGGMYYTMLEVIRGDVQEALSKGFETLSIAGALALGILVASSLTQVYLRAKKMLALCHLDDKFDNL